MIFSSSITTVANTLEAGAKITRLPVAKGLVYKFEVEFPPGCCGLLHCQVFDGSYQVYPTSRNDSFHTDARVVSFDDSYLKTAAPFEFTVKTWNLDETNGHEIQVRLGMASNEAFMSRYMPSISWEKFQTVLAKASLEQEQMKKVAIKQIAKELEDI